MSISPSKKAEKFFLLSVHTDSKVVIIGPTKKRGGLNMRGYFTAGGFYGLVDGKYILFPGEAEYYEYMEELGEVA
jgi:hypothetical protein